MNAGFAREQWNMLRVIEKVLRIAWLVFTGFLMIWVLVGCGWVFKDQECKTSKTYLGSYKIWAISMGILIFWLILFGLVALYFIVLGLKYLHFFRGYQSVFRLEYVLGFTFYHFLTFESMVKNI